MRTRIIFLLLTITILSNLNAQTERRRTRINESGKLESVGFEVKFNIPLFNPPRGQRFVDDQNLNGAHPHLLRFFVSLKQKYGPFKIVKQAPSYVWGDTLKPHVTDGRLVRVIDMSQWYFVRFEDFVPIEEILSDLRRFREVEHAYAAPEASPLSYPSPNDPRYPDQWDLTKIEASKAWAISKGSSGFIPFCGCRRN